MGIYSSSNTINIKTVDGSTFVGRYSPEGYWNGVDQSSNTSTFVGFVHPSGAINYVLDNGSTPHGIYHPNGSLYVTDNGTLNGGFSVTIISSGHGHLSSLILEDGSSYFLLEDGTSSILLE